LGDSEILYILLRIGGTVACFSKPHRQLYCCLAQKIAQSRQTLYDSHASISCLTDVQSLTRAGLASDAMHAVSPKIRPIGWLHSPEFASYPSSMSSHRTCDPQRKCSRPGRYMKAMKHNLILSSVLSTIALRGARCEPCLLCPGGQSTPLLDKVFDIDWPISVETCAELDSSARIHESDSDECVNFQSIATLCGCPKEPSACTFCETGSITMPDKTLSFLAPQFDGVAPSCELFEAHLHSISASDRLCYEAQAFSSACGCPPYDWYSNDPCHMCQGGDLGAPDQQLPTGYQMYFDAWGWNYLATCGLLNAVMVTLPADSDACL
jgi:hypothetical protein